MNQRLVESIAQTILSMTDEERKLLDRKLQSAGLQQLSVPTDNEKSLRITELVQEIHDFEQMYHTPLSELPAERWAIAPAVSTDNEQATSSDVSDSVRVPSGRSSSDHSRAEFLDANNMCKWPDVEAATAESPPPTSSFVQLTQLLHRDSTQKDEDISAFYDTPLQNGRQNGQWQNGYQQS